MEKLDLMEFRSNNILYKRGKIDLQGYLSQYVVTPSVCLFTAAIVLGML